MFINPNNNQLRDFGSGARPPGFLGGSCAAAKSRVEIWFYCFYFLFIVFTACAVHGLWVGALIPPVERVRVRVVPPAAAADIFIFILYLRSPGTLRDPWAL